MENDKFPVWKRLARSEVLNRGKYLQVENHILELPDGKIIENWPWVITPDVVNVLAKTKQGQYLCFRERKYAVGEISLSIVGGMVEDGEDPREAAKRELLEETGYRAERWIHHGRFILDANRGVGHVDLFTALDAVKVSEPTGDDLEKQELLQLSRGNLERALLAGEFQTLPWTSCIAMSLLVDQA